MKKTIPAMFGILCLFSTAADASDDARTFMQSLDGKYRGKGEIILRSDKPERVSCRIANGFAADPASLKIDGVCATTQGKTTVKGRLELKNGTITGSFLSPRKNSKITKSDSSFNNGILTISTSVVNNNTGALSKTRQIITAAKNGGFTSRFKVFDNKSETYKDAGSVQFQPSGE